MQIAPYTPWEYCTADVARTPVNKLMAMQLSAALRHFPNVTNDPDIVRRMNLLLLGSFLNNRN